MISTVRTCGLMGIDGFTVDVQADISNGMPTLTLVGLPGATVKEAKDRVSSAIKNSGFTFPGKKITINLAPADMRKEGSSYDLPIAVSILNASSQMLSDEIDESIFIGELALNGSVKPVRGVLPMVISMYKEGFRKIFVPEGNADEAAVIDDVEIYPLRSLEQLHTHLSGEKRIPPHKVDVNELFTKAAEHALDFCDVKGQEGVKRALEIAAAGSHNVLLIGSPGTGKTMLAKRLGSILPDLTFDESLEVTKIHSIAGVLRADQPLITERPFRNPHHTISTVGLSGGGSMPHPGELSLAHNGILFLDELPEFHRDVLEVMRQPLEDSTVTISRANATLTYPCNIMLVASMNPCQCGYFGDKRHKCTCTPVQIARYRGRISGPLLDRIDIQVEVPAIEYDKLSSLQKGESSAEIKKRVNRARKIQLERYKDKGIYSNSQLTAGMLDEFCRLGETENRLLKHAFNSMGLTPRAHSRILKVARTIADLDGNNDIKPENIAEAISFHSLDRKFFSNT